MLVSNWQVHDLPLIKCSEVVGPISSGVCDWLHCQWSAIQQILGFLELGGHLAEGAADFPMQHLLQAELGHSD
jgi:hypothetical protein